MNQRQAIVRYGAIQTLKNSLTYLTAEVRRQVWGTHK